jgi:hypothetical protein
MPPPRDSDLYLDNIIVRVCSSAPSAQIHPGLTCAMKGWGSSVQGPARDLRAIARIREYVRAAAGGYAGRNK